MRDRLPTPGKENRVKITQDDGSVIEGVLSYADEATQEGSAYTKGNVLPDEVCNLIGLPTTSEPADMFNVLSHVGDLHVWRRTVDGVVDYPVSTNRNAYQEGSGAKPAGYTLGAVQNKKTVSTTHGASYYYSDSITVDEDGTISLVDEKTFNFEGSASISYANSQLVGKFLKPYDENFVGLSAGVWFVPSNAKFTYDSSIAYTYVSSIQTVTGYPAIPACTTIEYLGNLGDKARVQNGSYVGNNTYGQNNPTSISFDFVPKFVIILSSSAFYFGIWIYGSSFLGVYNVSGFEITQCNATLHDKKLSWYGTKNSSNQLNSSSKYTYISIS